MDDAIRKAMGWDEYTTIGPMARDIFLAGMQAAATYDAPETEKEAS